MTMPNKKRKDKDKANALERGPKRNEPVCIGEDVKMGIQLALKRFRYDPTQTEIAFPSSLTTTERAFVHRVCSDLGSLKTWSRGHGQNRFISVAKMDDSKTAIFKPSTFTLVNCGPQVSHLMQTHPITVKDQQELLPHSQKSGKGKVANDRNGSTIGKSSPSIPPRPNQSELLQFRQSLPVYKLKDEILEATETNKVILVAGETGSGKSTQVPQLIMEKYCEANQPCKILCTQPRRLAAVSVSERIAAERGERIGQTVGYQIRLESKVSPNTVLTFCTTGVLLRSLMNGGPNLDLITHIIVDEAHERDRFTDFLLLCLKEALPTHKNLRVIVMSATLNMELFSGYFDNCPVVCVPGNLFPVDEFFLEDILNWTQYRNKNMTNAASSKLKSKTQEKNLTEWCSKEIPHPSAVASGGTKEESDLTISDATEFEEEKDDLEAWVIEDMDRLMQDVWLTGREDLFPQILYLISSENVSVDYIHPETSVTPLMIASGRGFATIVEHLLGLGANVNLKTSTDWTALDFARKFQQNDVADLLEAHSAITPEDMENCTQEMELVSAEDKELLTLYQHSFDDEQVDIDLVTALIYKLYSSSEKGGILVFLPGYDDIITLKTSIFEDSRFDSSKYILYVLHSSIQHADQKRVFQVPPRGVRKIVFSTNIAETSITINDIVFVVDSGKVKEKTFDALTSLTMLKSHWISKASALQRKGRAGRCQTGKCYHLFSRPRYLHLQDFQTPEILRLPLQELCLHTKLLAPHAESIATFLTKCPEAPPQLVITNAVQLLKRVDALDHVEDMTELGRHLCDLPIEPRFGKMVLYSVVMKCLDPVLTIVCTLSFRDPFVLPSLPSQKRAVSAKRKKFAEDTYSDHMVLLRAFQAWQKAKIEGWERPFCEKNFISSGTMEMLAGMRMQVMGQLKTSGFLRPRGPGDIRDLNTNSDNWALVKACLVAGTYPSVIQRTHKMALCTEKEPNVKFHNKSVLAEASSIVNVKNEQQWKKYTKTLPSNWMIYEEMTRLHRMAFAKCVTVVSAAAVFLFAGPSRLEPDALKDPSPPPKVSVSANSEDSEEDEPLDDDKMKEELNTLPSIQLDEWLSFKMENAQTALLSVQLRMKWHSLFLSRMRNPSQPWSQPDEAMLQVIVMLLSNAEKQMGMNNPVNVGQRPRAAGNVEEFLRQTNSGGIFQQPHFSQLQHQQPHHSQYHHQHSYQGHQHQGHHHQGHQHQGHQHFQHSHQGHQHFQHSHQGHQYQGHQNQGHQNQGHQNQGHHNSHQSHHHSRQGHQHQNQGHQNSQQGHQHQQSSKPGSANKATHNQSKNNNKPQSADPSPGHEAKSAVSVGGPDPLVQTRVVRGIEKPTDWHYFVMKCDHVKYLDQSQMKSVWATAIKNKNKMNKAFQSGKKVFVIFSILGSSKFQGFARMTSAFGKERPPDFIIGPKVVGFFTVEWEKRADLPFEMTHHLLNPWIGNKMLRDSLNGEEIEPSVGRALLKLFDQFPHQQVQQAGPGKSNSRSHRKERHSHAHHAKGVKDQQLPPATGKEAQEGISPLL